MTSVIENKTVWVTGASSGIGEAVVRELAKNKNFIIISARSKDKLEALAGEFEGRVAPLVYDVTDAESNAYLPERLQALTDHIDVVFMCAGTCEYDDGPYFDSSMYQRVMDTNFIGSVNTIRHALPFLTAAYMHKNAHPHIVGVGSLSSLAAFPRAEAYGASKAAFDYLMECASVDLKKKHISVSLVRPGFVDTALTRKNDFPMPSLMSAQKAASIIVAKSARRKRYIHFPFALSLVLRIAHMFPSLWVGKIAPSLIKKESI